MADSRPGGIEKIAHLFIAGNGASSARARDNSPLRWSSPAGGNGTGKTGVREGAPLQGPPAADSKPSDPAGSTAAHSQEPLGSDPAHLPTNRPSHDHPSPQKPSHDLALLQSLLSRAKVAAVLSGHMGPLAGPAAELFAKTLAREGNRVAMLYGPADLACLHRFSANGESDENDGSGLNNKHNRGGSDDSAIDSEPCDMLLLPDWVFQFDLWPMTRGVHSICLAYGAGSEGLMGAYGALKGLISRLGKPDELLLLPFGCNEQEETWVHERLAEMCRRFLELQPRLAHEQPDMHVRAGRLLPIEGGSEGVRQLFDAIGQPLLTLVPRRSRKLDVTRTEEPGYEDELPQMPQSDCGGETEGPVMADRQTLDVDASAEVTSLVPVPAVPRDGEAVLRALIEHRQAGSGAFFDVWSRQGVCGAVWGNEGLIGAAGEIRDLLGFALWLCRQAKVNDLDDLASITIAVRQPDEWLMEAARAMPVPVRWVQWRAFELGGQVGLAFETVA